MTETKKGSTRRGVRLSQKEMRKEIRDGVTGEGVGARARAVRVYHRKREPGEDREDESLKI